VLLDGEGQQARSPAFWEHPPVAVWPLSGQLSRTGWPAPLRPGDLRAEVRRRALPGSHRGADIPRRVDRPGAWKGRATGLRGKMDNAAAWSSPAHVRPLPLATPEAHRSIPRRRAAGQALHGDDQAMAERASWLGGFGLGGSKGLPAAAGGAHHRRGGGQDPGRNPCRVRGAGDEQTGERPVLTVAQVFELADLLGRRSFGNIRKVIGGYRLRYARNGRIHAHSEVFATRSAAEWALWNMGRDGLADTHHDRRYRALVLLATFAILRWGEATALRRCDIDLGAGAVRVRAALSSVRPASWCSAPRSHRLAAAWSAFPRRSSLYYGSTWRSMLLRHRALCCSPASRAGRCGEATSTRCPPGRRSRELRAAPKACTFTIFATPGGLFIRVMLKAPRNSCPHFHR